MKRRFRYFILLLMAVLLLLGSGATLAAGDDKRANEQRDMVHFVLIIDCTGSMDKADVEGMSVAAAELFVDMLPMDNATVSIICFGKLWQMTYEFKNGSLDEMKPFFNRDGKFNELLRADGRYITSLCETASLPSVTARSELKNKIEEANELLSANSITIANSAMLAAIDLLKSEHAEPENACIVMMSDGRVQVDRREAMDAVTAINPYPCYVLELNYDQKNTQTSIARKQLVNMAAKYDGDKGTNRYIEVKSAGDAIQAVSAAIGRFIDLQSVNPKKISVVNGESEEFEFTVPDMASETNIVVTGEGFQKMVLTLPEDSNGGKTRTYERTSTEDENDTFIRNADKYAVLKLKRPASGTYKLKVFGESGTNIYVHAVSAKELNLVLRASGYEPDTRDCWLKNDVIQFTAALEYEGDIVSNPEFYAKYPAQITIKNEDTNQQSAPIAGESNSNGYRWEIPLKEAGKIDVSVCLPCQEFRDGGKTSNTLTYTVNNLELQLGEGQSLGLPERMNVNELSGPLDVSKIFINPDCDAVAYSVACKNESGLSGNMDVKSPEEGVITLQMPEREGNYTATLSARDANMQQPISFDFAVNVVNRPIRVIQELSLDTIMIGQPTWLGGHSNTATYALSDYYADPDGLPLHYALNMGKKDNPNISIRLEGDSVVVHATGKGSEKTTLLVTDSSDNKHEVTLNARAENWMIVLFEQNLKWILAAIILVILVLIGLSLRRVKGGWYVSISGSSENEQVNVPFSTLTSQKSLRKPVISLHSVLMCVEAMSEADSSNLPNLSYVTKYPKLYGSLIGSRVVIKGLDAAHSNAEVWQGDNRLDRKRTRITLNHGEHLTLRYSNGMEEVLTVLLERK